MRENTQKKKILMLQTNMNQYPELPFQLLNRYPYVHKNAKRITKSGMLKHKPLP